jgi:polyisoprenoid-binding protein YceI
VRRTRWLLGGVLGTIVVLGAGGFAVWWFLIRSDAPPPPDIERAARAAASTTAPTGTTAAALDGRWTVDTSIGDLSAGTSTYVGYRIQEELQPIGNNTAVGRTSAVRGSLALRGDTVSAATVTADLRELRSDQDRRDNALRGRGLETDRFPNATFELTEPIALPASPADGRTMNLSATGRLTLHGVTRSVTIPLEAQLVGGRTIAVTGSTRIRLADYDIEKPTTAIVLSVADEGALEFQVFFTRA